MKRLNSIILIGAMLASVLAGCGNPQASEDSPKKEREPSANTTQNSSAQDEPSQNDNPQDAPNQNDTKQLAQQISKITYTYNGDGTVYSLVDTYEYDDNHGIRSHKQTVDGALYKDNTYDGSLSLPLSLAECWIDDDDKERWNIDTYSYKYDNDGNLIEEIDPYGCTKYEYDDHGNIIRMDYDDSCYEYTYQNENVVEVVGYYNGEVVYNCNYQYDHDGNLTESISRDAEGVSKSVYRYDANGNETDCMSYTDDKLTFQKKRSYDSNGNLITETIERMNMEDYNHSFRYEYNDDNLLVRQTVYNYKGYVRDDIEYKYDSNGNRIEMIYRDDDGVITRHDKYTRDENGFMTKLELSYDGDLIISAEFEYECVSVSEEQAAELAQILDQWANDWCGGFDYKWNY